MQQHFDDVTHMTNSVEVVVKARCTVVLSSVQDWNGHYLSGASVSYQELVGFKLFVAVNPYLS